MIEGKDFVLLPDPEDSQSFAIGLMDGDYVGIRYRYDKLKIDEFDDEAILNYSYTILENPDGVKPGEDFERHIGQVLHTLLTGAMESDTVEFKDKDGHRARNPNLKAPGSE